MNFLRSKFVVAKNNHNNHNNRKDSQQQHEYQDQDLDHRVHENIGEEEDLASLISSAPTDEITVVAPVVNVNMVNNDKNDNSNNREVVSTSAGAAGNGDGNGGSDGIEWCSDEFESETLDQQQQQKQQQQKKQVVHVMNIDISSHSRSHSHNHNNTSNNSHGGGGGGSHSIGVHNHHQDHRRNYNCPPPSTVKKKKSSKYNEPSPSPLVVRNRNRKKEKENENEQQQQQQQPPLLEAPSATVEDPVPAPAEAMAATTAAAADAADNVVVGPIDVDEVVEVSSSYEEGEDEYEEYEDEDEREAGPIDVDEVVVSSFEEEETEEREENQDQDDDMILPVKLQYDDDKVDYVDDDNDDDQQRRQQQRFHQDEEDGGSNVVDVNNKVIIQNVLNDMVDVVDKANELIMSPVPTPPVPSSSQQPSSSSQDPSSSLQQSSSTSTTTSSSSSTSTNRVISTWFSLRSSFLPQKQKEQEQCGKDEDKRRKNEKSMKDGNLEKMDSPSKVAETTTAAAASVAADITGGDNLVDGAVAAVVSVERDSMIRSRNDSGSNNNSNSNSSSTINVDTTPLPSDEYQNIEEDVEEEKEDEQHQRGEDTKSGSEQMMTATTTTPPSSSFPPDDTTGNHYHHQQFDDIIIHEHVDLYSSGSGSDNDHDHDEDVVYHTDSSSSPIVSSPPPPTPTPSHDQMKNRRNKGGISQDGKNNKSSKVLSLLASSSTPSSDNEYQYQYYDNDVVGGLQQTMTEETDDMITMTTICPSRSVDDNDDNDGNDNGNDDDEYNHHNYSDDDDVAVVVYPHYSARNDDHKDHVVSTTKRSDDTSSAESSEEEEHHEEHDDDDALQALEAFVTYAKDASPNTSSKLVNQLQRLNPVLTPLCDKSRVKTPQDILARNNNKNNNFDDCDGFHNKNDANSYDSPDAKESVRNKNDDDDDDHPDHSRIDLTEDEQRMEPKLKPASSPRLPPPISSPTVAEVFAVTGSAVLAVESTMRDITPSPPPPPAKQQQQHQQLEHMEKEQSMHQNYQVGISKPEQDVVVMRQQNTSSKFGNTNEDHKNASIDVRQQDVTLFSLNDRTKSLLDDDNDDDDVNQDGDGSSRNLIDISYFSTTSSWGEIERPPPTTVDNETSLIATDDDDDDDDDDVVVSDKNNSDTPYEEKTPTAQSAASSSDDDEDAYGSYTVDNSSFGADFQDLIADATSNATMMVAEPPSIASSTMMSLSMEPDDGVSVEDLESQQKVGNAKARLILAEMDTLPSGVSLTGKTEEKSNKSQDFSSSSFISPSAKGPVEKVDLTAPTPLVSNVATSNHKETIGLQTCQRTTISARKGSVKVIKSPADDVKHSDYIQLVTNTSAASITPQKSNRKGDPLSPALSCRSDVEDTKPPLEDGADMQFGDTPTSPKVAGGLFGRESPPLSPSCHSQDRLMLPVQEIATKIRSTNTPERVTSSMKKHRKSLSFDSSPFITGEEYRVGPSPEKNRYGTPIGPLKAYDDMNVSYDITASGRLVKSMHQTPKDSPTPQKRRSSFMDWLMPQRTANPWRLWQADDDDSSPRPLPSILGVRGGLDSSGIGSEDHQSVSDLESPNLATPVVDYKKFDFSDEESTIQSQECALVNPLPDSAEKSSSSATADRDADILSSQASEIIGSTVVDDVQGKSMKSQPRLENIALTESANKPQLTLKDEEPIPPSPQSLLTMSIVGCPTDEDISPKHQDYADSLVVSAVGCPADGGAVEQTSTVSVISHSAVSTSQQCPTDEGRLSSAQQADNPGSLLSAAQRYPTDESRSLCAVQDSATVKPIGVLRDKKNRNSLSPLPEDEPLLCEIPTASMDDKSYDIEDLTNRRHSFCSGRCMIITSILLAAGIVVGALLLTGTIETNSNPSSGTLPLPLPTELPTSKPSVAPSTDTPTAAPTLEPTVEPTFAPSTMSSSPTMAPSSATVERTSSPTTEYEGQLLWNRIETGEDVWRTFLGEQGINTPRWYFAGVDEDGSPTTAGGIQLDIVNGAAERYSSDIEGVVGDYSASRAVVELNVVDVPYDVLCRPEVGKVKVCSGDFGPTQWPGTSVLFLRGDLIVAAILQINSSTSTPSTPSFMKHSICHHFGHILGISHQKDSTSCMTDLRLDEQTEEIGGRPVMIPEEWQHPNEDDLDELVDIYGPAPTRRRRRRRQLDKHHHRLRG